MSISFQIYSARNYQPWADVVASLAGIGYRNIEGFGPVYEDAAAFRVVLDQYGMAMPSGHFSLEALEDDLEGVVHTANTLGIQKIICPWLHPDQRPTDAYLRLCPLFKGIEVRACADINPAAAEARASEFKLRADTVEDLLASADIDVVVNLTIPATHFSVSKQALLAGKHVYSEKPFVLSLAEGQELAELAQAKGLRVGSAPDTFLGGAHQLARHLIDSGKVGRVTAGTCFVQSPGMEMWHPNPEFFFQPGGGPILDMGPYYISNLVQLLGPVKRVGSLTSKGSETRTITSQPLAGEKIKVNTPTTIQALLEFHSGATIMFGASWDVWHQSHPNMELYGSEGTLYIPDPNFFGGEVRMTQKGAFVNGMPTWEHPFSQVNDHEFANYRTAGLADMAQAILENRPQRCSLEFALHVVDVMTSILAAGEQGQFLTLSTTCTRPAALGVEAAQQLLR